MADDSGMQGKSQEELDAEDDELSRRRASRAGSESDPDEGGESIEDIEGRAGDEEDEDGQFVFEIPDSGKKVTLGTMVPRGTPVEIRYKMSGKSIPNVSGGMLDPSDTSGLLLASYTVEDVDTKFTRDADGKITKATIYIVIAPKHVVNARSEAGAQLLGEYAAA